MKPLKLIVDDKNRETNKVGQGELYSPNHALKINTKNLNPNNYYYSQQNNPNNFPKEKNQHNNNYNQNNQDYNHHKKQKGNNNNNHNNTMVGKGVANEIKNKMSMVKERLMEKLAAASVPSDALENAKHYFESVIKDVTSAAQGITKEALQRIKSHLADLLPSLSPSLTSKMVDDAETEATSIETREDDEGNDVENENYQEHKGKAYASPASSLFSNLLLKPTSKL